MSVTRVLRLSNYAASRRLTTCNTQRTIASMTLRFADVGINLTDAVYQGSYHGKKAHEGDLEAVIERARGVGCEKFMVTGSSLQESRHAISIASRYPGCFATVGVHPCSTQDFNNPSTGETLLGEIEQLAREGSEAGHVVAFGEIGLDYDRLFLSPKEAQLEWFEKQLDVAVKLQLPLFLHSRAAADDFERLLKPRLEKLPKGGLVHSFTGTKEELHGLLKLGVHVGVNGCSLKTEENLAVVKQIPLDRLQIETDGPWCEIRASHASAKSLTDAPELPKAVKKEKFELGAMVKGRNEPIAIRRVAHVVANVKGISVEEVAEAAWRNSTSMFGLSVDRA